MARFTGGWVKIHRSLTEKDIIQNINLFAIWNYLLLIAVYKDSQLLWCGKQRILKPGSCVLGINQLAKQWDLSPRTISKWLHYLHSTGRIVLESCAVGTLVTICNWEEYQLIEKEVCAPTAHDVRADCAPTARQVALSEEGKKERNTNTGSHEPEYPLSDSQGKKRRLTKGKKLGIRMTYSGEFEEVWKLYGCKGDKKSSFEVWKQLGLTDSERETLSLAIKAYQEENPDKQYRKDFERFLQIDWREKAAVYNDISTLTQEERITRGFEYRSIANDE